MKRTLLIFAASFLLLIGFATSGFAHSFDFSDLDQVAYGEYTDTSLFDYGTPTLGALNAGLGNYVGSGKQTAQGGIFPNVGDKTILDIFINEGFVSTEQLAVNTYSGAGNYAGWWTSLESPGTGNFIDFIVVKAATSFSIHQYIPASQEGLWDVGRLYLNPGGQTPDMSFVRAYTGGTPVPEPATMLWLGTALFGLFMVSRKKFMK